MQLHCLSHLTSLVSRHEQKLLNVLSNSVSRPAYSRCAHLASISGLPNESIDPRRDLLQGRGIDVQPLGDALSLTPDQPGRFENVEVFHDGKSRDWKQGYQLLDRCPRLLSDQLKNAPPSRIRNRSEYEIEATLIISIMPWGAPTHQRHAARMALMPK